VHVLAEALHVVDGVFDRPLRVDDVNILFLILIKLKLRGKRGSRTRRREVLTMPPVVGSSPTPTLLRRPQPRVVPVLAMSRAVPVNSSMFQNLMMLRPVLSCAAAVSTLSSEPRERMSLLGSLRGTTRVRVWW